MSKAKQENGRFSRNPFVIAAVTAFGVTFYYREAKNYNRHLSHLLQQVSKPVHAETGTEVQRKVLFSIHNSVYTDSHLIKPPA